MGPGCGADCGGYRQVLGLLGAVLKRLLGEAVQLRGDLLEAQLLPPQFTRQADAPACTLLLQAAAGLALGPLQSLPGSK